MKSSWPELVGKRGEEAKIISEDAIVMPVVVCERVYVRVNDCGIVTQTPFVG
ncbi:hypothetical protein Bca52824_068065 [Brassica carinata]|uniref:Uncharacterized protein n=1 Tax=Brassica carinata TaxID=52824 RepID=A0A8X7U1J7_BRACI|nr:hypothetical protein Bca52824_068065 [Brassica carinata]